MKKYSVKTNIDIEIKSPVVKTIIAILLVLLLLFFIVYPITVFRGEESSIRTRTALTQTVHRTIDADAFVVRQELCISNKHSGTLVPAVKNGSKVAVNDVVANVYSSTSAAENADRLEDLEEEINYYESVASSSANALQADINVYKKGVTEDLYALTDAIESGNLSVIDDLSKAFRASETKKQIAMGKSPDVSATLASLKTEYEKLKNSSVADSVVTAQQAGYYVSTADGYENIIAFSDVKTLTADKLDAAFASSPEKIGADNVGKIITDFNWYLVLNAQSSELGNISVGKETVVTFENTAVGDMKMRVIAINQTDATSPVTIILTSNIMNEDVAALRNVSVKLRVETFTGLTVDSKALRTVNGVKGVYIKVGNIAKFRKIDILYSDESIVLCGNIENESGYLKLYDEIIIEGTDLYDSKLLD